MLNLFNQFCDILPLFSMNTSRILHEMYNVYDIIQLGLLLTRDCIFILSVHMTHPNEIKLVTAKNPLNKRRNVIFSPLQCIVLFLKIIIYHNTTRLKCADSILAMSNKCEIETNSFKIATY